MIFNKTLFPVVILLVTLITGCYSQNNDVPFEMNIQRSDVVSLAEYHRIDDGMSYSQVVSIVGDSGTESSSSTMKGVPGVVPSITTKIYTWQNSDGSNMNAMFQNDKLITKAQALLK